MNIFIRANYALMSSSGLILLGIGIVLGLLAWLTQIKTLQMIVLIGLGLLWIYLSQLAFGAIFFSAMAFTDRTPKKDSYVPILILLAVFATLLSVIYFPVLIYALYRAIRACIDDDMGQALRSLMLPASIIGLWLGSFKLGQQFSR